MNESKKGLRIVAGILLLLVACYSAFSTLTAFATILQHGATVSGNFVISVFTQVLSVLTAIFILTRKFTAAAVMRCVILAASAVMLGVSFARTSNGFSLDALRQGGASIPLSVAMRCASFTASILIIIGLFLHNRKAMPLLIVAAVLLVAAAIGQAGATLLNYIELYGADRALDIVGTSMIQTIAPALLALPAWILLGVYFGAQNKNA